MEINVLEYQPNTPELRALCNRSFGTWKQFLLFVAEDIENYHFSHLSKYKDYYSAPEGARSTSEEIASDMVESAEEQGLSCRHMQRILRDMIFLVAAKSAQESSTPLPTARPPHETVGRQRLAILPQGPIAPHIPMSQSSSAFATVAVDPCEISPASLPQPATDPPKVPNVVPNDIGGVYTIMAVLLTKLRKDEERGYKQWLMDDLKKDMAKRVTRILAKMIHANPALKQLCQSEKFRDKEALLQLKQTGDPLDYHGYGFYMDVITDDNDPQYVKLYVGQAEDMRDRVRYHLKKKGTVQSLHYTLLKKPGRKANFVVLGKLAEPTYTKKDLDIVLNIGEAWFSLVFQSVPVPTLQKYLPKHVSIRSPHIGANVANPLNQGHKDQDRAQAAFRYLKDSDDPEVRAYHTEVSKKGWQKSYETRREREFVQNIEARREISRYTDLGPDPERGRPARMKVWCSRCSEPSTAIWDPAPTYTDSGEYLAREKTCATASCPRNVIYIPLDTTVPYLSQRLHHRRIREGVVNPRS